MQPLFIQVHPRDNVAIVVNNDGLAEGAQFANGLVLTESVPQAHKIALRNLEKGAAVVRYGQTIGTLNRAIRAGSWVREDVIDLPLAPTLGALPLATAIPAPLPALEGFTFEGYPNPDGMVGTRNILGITTTVQCVAPTVDHAVRRIEAEILPRFPGVDGVVAITHGYGCGVAIDAPDAAIPIRTLRNLSQHPNFGGAPLLVSLGCEKLQAERLLPGLDFQWIGKEQLPLLDDKPYALRLQNHELRGFGDIVTAIMRFAEKRLVELDRRQRRTVPASHLVVGLQCGGSDAFSGVTCNPAVGYAADLLVRAGGTVLFRR
jgi:galactarate dehydratase